MEEAGLGGSLVEDDNAVWARQRDGQRSESGSVVRVSGVPSRAAELLAAATRLSARVVGRAALGISWLVLDERSIDEQAAAVDELRRELSPSPCVVLDAPAGLRVDRWGPLDPGVAELMRRVRERFDPAAICNPGIVP
jgi:hypothetical protein